ncbi:MAG: hypothetical protein O7G31_12355 [Calditrichaeota bacterium]|nr:hypothetical protein [Calditrichota bacterium]
MDPSQSTNEQFILLVGLQSNPESVPPGGDAIITALVLDQNSSPVGGETVQFSTNIGSLSPTTSTSNDSGIVVSRFTAPARSGTAQINAVHTSGERTTTVIVQDTTPQSITLTSGEESLLADGRSFTWIESVWRTQEGFLLKGIPITWETSAGKIAGAAFTDSLGVARALLTSEASRTDLIAQVTARGNDLQAAIQVILKGINFSLTVFPTTMIADGQSSATVTAVLKESTSSVAISGARITFGASLGTIPNSQATNASGIAAAILTSSLQTGISTIIATYGEGLVDTVQVAFSLSIPTNLDITAQPSEILADNRSTSRITAVVSDQTNNAVPDGTPVNFNIISGSGTIESQKVTDGGVAISTVTSGSTPDIATVVVQVGSLSDTTRIRFVTGPPASITVSADSSSLPADGKTTSRIVAELFDSAGNSVIDGTKVDFSTSIGEITASVQTVNGLAVAQFSSSNTGTAVIQAQAGGIFGSVSMQLRPGPPNSVLLFFDPNSLGVKDSGRNQTVTITAEIVDSQNNFVADGTYVLFSIFAAPGGGESLSSSTPLPTVNGRAHISLNSGIRSGSVRIMAQVTDALGIALVPEVRAISTEVIIFAGPPFIEDVNNRFTSHLSVGAAQTNVLGWGFVNTTTTMIAVVGDRFNNPVPAGTAVFFTTTGGVISTHTGFTNEEGVATVTIHTAQPLPDIMRYYNTFDDPNKDHPNFALGTSTIPGPIPDFEGGQVVNSLGGVGENDGITRVLAVTEGVNSNGVSSRAWAVTSVVFSGLISTFNLAVFPTDLSPGEAAIIDFEIYDVNGNPIVPDSQITILASAGSLSWNSLATSDPGTTTYQVSLTNDIDPSDPDAKATSTSVAIQVTSVNGNVIGSTVPINLNLN